MHSLIDFFSFSDPNVRYVVVGNVLLSASAAMVGAFILLQKKALVGDAVSHAVLPGICAAFLFSGSKNTAFMLVGAFITGWLALVAIDYITAKSKIKKDAAIGLVLSVFFGAGMVMMTYIQQSGNAAQSGLDHFIFGKAATLIGSDLVIFSILAAVLLVVVGLFFKAFTLVAFDRPYAQALGYPVRKLDLLLTSLTVLAVVTGITAVGVVLMAAMLITPAAAARYWTDNIRRMVGIAVAFGMFAGLAGAY
ncbi:metal ABC transporter permease, partial [Parapedobacter pyrenivorans]|uniref:metal ABC transporter permease n=1 Tax=Parapedobacter pyrenivorans TaxID=1305674 RepID=UPI00333FEC42